MKTSKTAVILIDMQDFFLKQHTPENRRALIANQSKVIECCQKNKIPLILFEYKTRGIYRGSTTKSLLEKIKKVPEVLTLIKESNSAFTDTDLHAILTAMKCKKLLVMGINANACVQDTTISAIQRGYKVVIAKGLTASTLQDGKDFSPKNEAWYKEHSLFLENTQDAIKEILH